MAGVDVCIYICAPIWLHTAMQGRGFTDYNLQSWGKIYQETGTEEDAHSHGLYL